MANTTNTVPCTRCAGHPGVGIYTWGGTVNGRPRHAGTCFRCQGTGRMETRAPQHVAKAIEATHVAGLRISDKYEVVITVEGNRFRATLVAGPAGTGPLSATSVKGQREAAANVAKRLKEMGFTGAVKVVSWAR